MHDVEARGSAREQNIDATLAALADPTRRAVIDLLRQNPRRAGELASLLEVSPPSLSRHLRLLRAQGLVQEEEEEHDARVRLYSLRPEPFRALRGWLDEVELFWAGQLSAFKQHAERTRPKRAELGSRAEPRVSTARARETKKPRRRV
jgi:DNA-binding transcriptional ArsR family regulator